MGTEVTVDGAQVRSVTDEQGAFRLGGVPYGTPHRSTSGGLASLPPRLPSKLLKETTATVSIRLRPLATTLPPVVIRPARMNYTGRLAGIIERLERRSNGYFITRDSDRPRRSATPRSAATARARRDRGAGKRWDHRNKICAGVTCWPLVWIDGTPMPSGEVDLDSFSPTTIHGIELYLGSTDGAGALHIHARRLELWNDPSLVTRPRHRSDCGHAHAVGGSRITDRSDVGVQCRPRSIVVRRSIPPGCCISAFPRRFLPPECRGW